MQYRPFPTPHLHEFSQRTSQFLSDSFSNTLHLSDSFSNTLPDPACTSYVQAIEGSVKFQTKSKQLNSFNSKLDRGASKSYNYQCQFCEKAWENKYKLSRHMLTHTGQKPYQCNMCLKRFTQKSHMENHKVTHLQNWETFEKFQMS